MRTGSAHRSDGIRSGRSCSARNREKRTTAKTAGGEESRRRRRTMGITPRSWWVGKGKRGERGGVDMKEGDGVGDGGGRWRRGVVSSE